MRQIILYKRHISHFTSLLVLLMLIDTNFSAAQEKSLQTSISPNMTLDKTNEDIKVKTGDNLLFEIKISKGGDPRVDASVTTTLLFEIPKGLDQFNFTAGDFNERTVYVRISNCRCMDSGYNPVVKGILKGKKQKDGSWSIAADVVAEGKDTGKERCFQFKGSIKS